MVPDMNITLPDGSKRELKEGSTGLDLGIWILVLALPKLQLLQYYRKWRFKKILCDPIEAGLQKFLSLQLIHHEGLEIMRHTLTAQVLARAVKNLYTQILKLAIGPTIS